MGKSWFAFAATFLASIAQGGAPKMQAQQITLSPTPIFAGDTVTITAGPNMKVVVELSPPGTSVTLTTGDNGQVTYVPGNAGSLYVSDPAGNWTTATAIVQP